ncbi:P-loop containing nucleoside triphosphate hydrolase protein [Halenospora varia]|nr:P-loop containing nucleoside triphosphate hydrolase protein [Halenospora varia]
MTCFGNWHVSSLPFFLSYRCLRTNVVHNVLLSDDAGYSTPVKGGRNRMCLVLTAESRSSSFGTLDQISVPSIVPEVIKSQLFWNHSRLLSSSNFNMSELYHYYQYLYRISSLFGFLIFLLNSPKHTALLLKIIGISHTTIFAKSSFKDICNHIERAVIASNPRQHNSIVAPYREQAERHDNVQEIERPDSKATLNSKLRYAIDNDTLARWYCDCHGLSPFSASVCRHGGLLCLTYSRPIQPQFGQHEPASWQLLGSYATRTLFLERMSRSRNCFAVITIYKPQGEKRRDITPWKSPIEVHARPANTVILEDTTFKSILERVQLFVDTKTQCLERGLPPQVEILFHSPPGTGKSSLVKVIAQRFHLPIYIFNLGDTGLTDSQLIAMFDEMLPNAIALFEDIDRAKIGKQGITEAGLLNALDGVGTQSEGRLTIMTCNDRAMVPAAVTRKGRIDTEYYFSLASTTQAKNLFLSNNLWTSKDTEGLNLDRMADEFAEAFLEHIFSPADITAYLKEAESPKGAIDHVRQFVNKSLEAKNVKNAVEQEGAKPGMHWLFQGK